MKREKDKKDLKEYYKKYYLKNKKKIYATWRQWAEIPENKIKLRDYYRNYQRIKQKIPKDKWRVKDGL